MPSDAAPTEIGEQDVRDFGIYEELGVIVFGIGFDNVAAIYSLIFQIDTEEFQCERSGMCVEHNENGWARYGVVRQFELDHGINRLHVFLDSKDFGVVNLLIHLPPMMETAERALLAKMARRFKEYPRLDDPA